MTGEFHFITADWTGWCTQIRYIRRAVFVQEQGIPEALEWDALDPDGRHVLASTAEHEAIGTGRLTLDGRIGRMAVLPPWRGQGVGRGILEQLISIALHSGHTSLYLHAQCAVEDFYHKAGFRTEAVPFDEAGITHVKMVKLMRLARISHRAAVVSHKTLRY